MQLNNRYHEVFGRIPIFGMIHLAGCDPVMRAMDEISIFEEEGVDGAIVENYHGSVDDVIATLEEMSSGKSGLVIGVNILPNEFCQSFPLACKYGADFVQLDHVAGKYRCGELDLMSYSAMKSKYPGIIVLGGVWPKYYHPVEGSDLSADLMIGMQRAEAIVVTGAGTGMVTPLDKIIRFREVLGGHPLVVGAGLTPDNAYEQLCVADGAIVGSCLKYDNETYRPVDRMKVRDFMAAVREAREYQASVVPSDCD